MDKLSDLELVGRVKKGDNAAFSVLVQRYENKIYNLAYRFVGNHADACDLAQETFIKLYHSLHTYRGEASFATWLYRVATNVCRDELRRQQRQKKLSLDEMVEQPGFALSSDNEQEMPEEVLEKKELQEQMQNFLLELSDEHRIVLIMREVQQLSYEEIAAALECSLGTVKSRLNRARQALKQKFLGQTREQLVKPARLAR
ncbi:MAG: sigma-70 family RNA polymerase sigma factor [Bacillota bacterium]